MKFKSYNDGMTRTALITGGSLGLGRALATALVADGWTVVVDGRDRDALAALDPRITTVAGDVTDARHRDDLLHAVGPRLDLLVNNASTLGASPQPRTADLDPATFTRVLDVNLVAPAALTALVLPALRVAGGAVVNVTSDASAEAYEGWGAYSASKAGLDHLSAITALEHPDVRVWAFDPGDMRTRMHQEAFPGDDISDRPEPETAVPALLRLIGDRPPSGRVRASDLLAEASR